MKLITWAWKWAVRLYNYVWFTSGRNIDPKQAPLRRDLLRRFRRIDAMIDCLHTEKELLAMVDFLLSHSPEGCLVECGSYLGGSSAKLSLVAAATGRDLYVCDSFKGLPQLKGADGKFSDAGSGVPRHFTEGEFAAQREVVEENVRRWGKIEVCRFVEGFFSDSLPTLLRDEQIRPAFIFADVDLVASTHDVLRNLWPRLLVGGRFYTHDANLSEFCEGIMDGAFWRDELGEFAPVLFGAGHGLGFQAGSIAYCRKR
jgi:hypothetical protein